MHFIQCKQFSKTNVTLHAFEQISDFKTFPECFRGPLKTLWRATCGPRACSWTTQIYLMQHRNRDLYSCIACESQSFKRVFYLKHIFVITGAPLERRARGNCPHCPSLIRPCPWWSLETWSRSRVPFLRVSVSKISGLETEYCKVIIS